VGTKNNERAKAPRGGSETQKTVYDEGVKEKRDPLPMGAEEPHPGKHEKKRMQRGDVK